MGKAKRSKPEKENRVVCAIKSIVSKLSLRFEIGRYNSRELESEEAACIVQDLFGFQVPNHTKVNGMQTLRSTVYLDESRVNRECTRI